MRKLKASGRDVGRIARCIAVLVEEGPMSYEELMERTGASYVTLQKWVRALRREKLVHISGFTERTGTGGQPRMLFSWGKGKDARRPKVGSAEIQRNYRAKLKMLEMIRATAGTA